MRVHAPSEGRRTVIVLVLAAALFTAGFALAAREERRITDLTDKICAKQAVSIKATQSLRPVIEQAAIVARGSAAKGVTYPVLLASEERFLRLTGTPEFRPASCP